MPDPDLSDTVLDGRYKVIAPIAEGAMGSVYRGERLKLGRAVAIKIMHQSLPDELASRQRFEREAKLMALLEHPHCVSVIDFGVHEDKPYLVMELVRGTSLMELIDKHGRVEVTRAADILRQVLSGLAHAHELGIVHRDIKPANIMVTEKTGLGEQVRILDFGLARLTEQSTKLTTGIVVGTPNYMAPEQIKGGDLDARTDLYACGVLLFEMLTGRKPFVAEDPIAVVRKHLNDSPPRLADLAPDGNYGELETVVARALAKSPADRYANAVDMAAAIDAAVARRGTQTPAVGIYARAVPQTAASLGPQVATPSGWNVPAGAVESPPPDADPAAPELAPPTQSGPAAVPERASTAPSGPSQSAPTAVLPAASGPTADPAFTASTGTSIALGAVPPPARPPARAAGPAMVIPGLPLTRRHLLIGGGVLFGLILLMGILAAERSPADRSTGSAGSGSAAHVASGSADPLAPLVARGNELYNAGDVDEGIELMRRARRQYPDSADLAFVAGKLYFAKLWFTDGVKNFKDAVRLDPAYTGDPDLIKIVVRGFNTTPDVDDRLESFLREDIGQAAVPYLEDTAKTHSNKAIRARAAAELRRFH